MNIANSRNQPKKTTAPLTSLIAIALVVAMSLGIAASGGAAEIELPAHVTAAINDTSRWERDRKRDQRSKPAAILTFMGVAPGDAVLDLFTGGGYWAELFARAVGESGSVVAHTNQAYRNFAGRLLTSRFENDRIPGVRVIDTELDDLALGTATFDHIFIGLGYHDLYFYADFWPLPGRDRFFQQLFSALKPGGSVTIIDHAALPGTGPTAAQTLHRIDENFAKQDWQRAGFVFVGSNDSLRNDNDSRQLDVFHDDIRRKTDRFVMKFQKPL